MLRDFQETKQYLEKFYLNLIRNHPQSRELAQKFYAMLNQIEKSQVNKCKKAKTLQSNLTVNYLNRFDSLSPSSAISHDLSSQNSSQHHEQNCFQYHASLFIDAAVFGYIYTLIKNSQQTKISLINLRINKLINKNHSSEQQNKKNYGNCLAYWKKIISFVSNKEQTKWAHKLTNYYISLNSDFKKILHESIDKLSPLFIELKDADIDEKILKKMSNHFMMSILYWRGNEKIQSNVYTGKIQIKYVETINKSQYVFVDREPLIASKLHRDGKLSPKHSKISKRRTFQIDDLSSCISTEQASPKFAYQPPKFPEIAQKRPENFTKWKKENKLILKNLNSVIADYKKDTVRLLSMACLK